MATYMRLNMFVLAALVMGAIFQGSEAQTTHIVGDSNGWRIPSGGAATYTTWASQQNFSVGDVLVFNFIAGTHDVAEVTKSNYDGCTTTSPISSTTTSPASITLSSSGEHYFLCTFSGHCDAGQKLSVTVSEASTATPPTTTATPPIIAATPPTTTATPPIIAATPPTTTATPPTIAVSPPSTTIMPPSAVATPPTTTATPPSSAATPPTTTATPPSSAATPPTTTATPPSTTTTPPSPSDSDSAASTLTLAALPVALLSFALAFLH